MSEVGPDMNRVAERWKEALFETEPVLDVARSRERFLETFELRTRAARGRAWPWALAVAAALILVMGAWAGGSRAGLWRAGLWRAGLWGGAEGGAGAVEPGAWIETRSSETFPLEFSEGSKILLESKSRAQVASVDPRGARVVLLRGGIKANIVHRPDTAWAFTAGPFTVNVTGTELRVSWDPTAQQFEVSVERGSVWVTGPLVESGRPVTAGQRCAVSMIDSKLELMPSAPPKASVAPPAESASPLTSVADSSPKSPAWSRRSASPYELQRPATAAEVSSNGGKAEGLPIQPSWKELEQQGRYREAVEAARREGLDGICGSGSSEDLMALARAARLAGAADVGKVALLKVRERFAGAPQAARAAFLLGRSAPSAEAAEWFATYLREQPAGPLAREAAGRLMEAYQRAGNQAAAKDAASKYLASYPGGPHATFARQVLRK